MIVQVKSLLVFFYFSVNSVISRIEFFLLSFFLFLFFFQNLKSFLAEQVRLQLFISSRFYSRLVEINTLASLSYREELGWKQLPAQSPFFSTTFLGSPPSYGHGIIVVAPGFAHTLLLSESWTTTRSVYTIAEFKPFRGHATFFRQSHLFLLFLRSSTILFLSFSLSLSLSPRWMSECWKTELQIARRVTHFAETEFLELIGVWYFENFSKFFPMKRSEEISKQLIAVGISYSSRFFVKLSMSHADAWSKIIRRNVYV